MRASKGKGQEKRARNRFGESEVGATDPARHPFGLFKFGRRAHTVVDLRYLSLFRFYT